MSPSDNSRRVGMNLLVLSPTVIRAESYYLHLYLQRLILRHNQHYAMQLNF